MICKVRIHRSIVVVSGFAVLAAAGCGTGLTSNSRHIGVTVVLSDPSPKAVVAGPATFHAYSEFAGGVLYTVAQNAGTHDDCRLGAPTSASTKIGADHVLRYQVPQGQVVCVSAMKQGFELLWHTVGTETPTLTSHESLQARN